MEQPVDLVRKLRAKVQEAHCRRVNDYSVTDAQGWAAVISVLIGLGGGKGDSPSAEKFLPFKFDEEKEAKITPKAARILKRLYEGKSFSTLFWRSISEIMPDVLRLGK